jgi:hypothetical protein
MATDANNEDKNLEVVENPDGSVAVAGLEALAGEETAEQPEQPAAHDDDEEGDEDNSSTKTDAELAGAANDEERERIRAARREERITRRQRRKDATVRHQRELQARDQLIDQMRARLSALEKNNSGADVARVDARIRQEQSNIEALRDIIADATKVGNGAAAAEATVKLTESMLNVRELDGFRKRVARVNETQEAPQLDPRMVVQASSWMEDNKWYNPQGADADSRQVLAIDARLYEEGYDPKTSAYWEELSSRVKAALPHKERLGARQPPEKGYNADGQRKSNRSVVTGSGAESGGANSGASRSGFLLSPDRVQALKDAGIWDNPKSRNDAIRRYREYDTTQKSDRNTRA